MSEQLTPAEVQAVAYAQIKVEYDKWTAGEISAQSLHERMRLQIETAEARLARTPR